MGPVSKLHEYDGCQTQPQPFLQESQGPAQALILNRINLSSLDEAFHAFREDIKGRVLAPGSEGEPTTRRHLPSLFFSLSQAVALV